MRCSKCKLQYVGKANTEFNLQINKYRKDILKSNAILAVRHLAHKAGADSEILKKAGGDAGFGKGGGGGTLCRPR